MSRKEKSNARKKTEAILFGQAQATLFEGADYYRRRQRADYGNLFRERSHARLQTVSIEPRETGQTSEIARRFGLLGIAKRNRESDFAAEKQQTASIDKGGKETQSRDGKKAREGRKRNSPIEGLSDIERTLPASPKTIRIEI